MATLNQIREGFSEAWDSVLDGWQKLYRRAAGALTRFIPGKKHSDEAQELEVRSSGWGVLAAEVYDDDEQVIVRLEVPGMEKEDFDLEVVNDYLVVRGEKRLERERKEGQYHITECAYGSFERVIPLPEEVQPDKAKASYRKGILRVELPKSENSRRRKIDVAVK